MRVAGSSVLGVQGGARAKKTGTARSGADVGTSVLADWSPVVCGLEGSVPMRLSRKPIGLGTVRSRFGCARVSAADINTHFDGPRCEQRDK